LPVAVELQVFIELDTYNWEVKGSWESGVPGGQGESGVPFMFSDCLLCGPVSALNRFKLFAILYALRDSVGTGHTW